MAPAPPNQQPGCRPPPIRAGRGRSRRQARLRRSPPQCAKPYSRRLRARRRRRQRARRRASSRGALGVGRRGRLLCLVFVPGPTLRCHRPPPLSPRPPGVWRGNSPFCPPRLLPGACRSLVFSAPPRSRECPSSRLPGRARRSRPGARTR